MHGTTISAWRNVVMYVVPGNQPQDGASQDTGVHHRMPLGEWFSLRCEHYNSCLLGVHDGRVALSQTYGDHTLLQITDFDGTWFRIKTKHEPGKTFNVENGGKTAGLCIYNDKYDNSLFRVVDDNGTHFRLQNKQH